MYSNDFISDQFSLLSKLMDIHGENPFKSKSYSAAAFTIDKLPIQLHTLSPADIVATKGIGESTGRKILEILETGKLGVLDQLIALTPSGILDMLQIKGIGPKKINTIWKEMQIESLGELLYACNENRLLLYKGFGDKTQQHVKDAIEFFLSHQDQLLQALFPEFKIELTGAIRRQLEIIRELEYVTTISGSSLKLILNDQGFELRSETNDLLVFKSGTIPVQFRLTNTEQFNQIVFETSCSEEFLAAWKKNMELPVYPQNKIISAKTIYAIFRHV